jgi:hypothetical protein
MISIDTFLTIREQYGHFASWAVWAEEGVKPKDNIGDLSVFDLELNPSILHTLHAKAILLGLNISRAIQRPLGNFHDTRSQATDYKIRYALRGTDYWGCYMTDIIKDFEEKSSGKMTNFLRSHRDFEKENILKLRQEIETLDVVNPLLVVFGKDAEMIAKRNLSDEFEIVCIPHYATYTSKEKYRSQLEEILPSLNIIDKDAYQNSL